MSEIEALEAKKNQKRHTMYRGLRNSFFGTLPRFDARDTKNRMRKELARRLWDAASIAAGTSGSKELAAVDIDSVLAALFVFQCDDDGHWTIKFADNHHTRINGTGKR